MTEGHLESDLGVELAVVPADPPCIRLLILVVQRFNLLLLLLLTQLGRVGVTEELGGKLNQPLGVNGCDLSHVFFGGEHQLMVDNPEGGGSRSCIMKEKLFG